MQLKSAFRDVYRNLMLTAKGDVIGLYKASPVMIPAADYEKVEDYKSNLAGMFAELQVYEDIHLEMYPLDMNLEERFAHLEKDFDETSQEIGRYYNSETIQLLEAELGSVTSYEFILTVRIRNNLLYGSEAITDVVKNAVGSVTDTLVQLMGLEKRISSEFFDRFVDLEKEAFEKIQSYGFKRLTEDEVIYINRYNFLRDIHHSVEEEKKKRGMTNITDCIIDPTEMGYLKLQTTEGQCYISNIVVDEFPLNMDGTHLFQRAQQLPFPVEVHVKAKFVDNHTALRKINMIKQRFKETDNDRYEAGEDEDDKLVSGAYVLNRVKNQLSNDNACFMKWVAIIVVHGKTKSECKQRANEVIRYMKSIEIQCVRPIADQLQLFYKFLHGQPLEFERNWVQWTTHQSFAENLFAVSSQLGTKAGFYLGRVDKYITTAVERSQSIAASRDIVLFHPFIANEGIAGATTDSPHIAITGQTGKGKSFLTKLLFMYLTFLDVKVLYIDPKSEMRKWFERVIDDPYIAENYPLFVEHLKKFHYVTLDVTDPTNWGTLDPICFLEGAEAKDLAQGIVEQIYDMNGKDDVKTALLKTLNTVIEKRARGERVGFMHVIEKLQQHEEKAIKNAGDLLYELTQNSVLQLIFSYGQTKALNLNNKVNILQIEGLDLPSEDDDPRYYTDSERKSLCLMHPLAKFCEKFGSKDKTEKTAEIFDEAWMLTSARGGKKLTKQMRRVGRSYKNALIFVTQSVSDVQSEDDKGNFGVTFAFDESREREDILKYLNLENTHMHREMLKNMLKGQCIFSDFYGRVGKVSIDCLFDEWAEAFKTVEKSHSAMAEEAMM
ncbi:ATP-binding protein [Bacillus pseudomycoides]|uniref:ATP-binding protein n=1 Tax=Bacillus pseudomycoides TaxID=64104 RepID=UPI003D1DBF65